jgi:hypothetical protein
VEDRINMILIRMYTSKFYKRTPVIEM